MNIAYQTKGKFILGYYSGWILWIFFYTAILVVNIFPFKTAIIDSIIYNSTIGLMGYGFHIILRYYRPGINKLHFLAGWAIVGSIIANSLSWLITWFILGNNVEYMRFLSETLHIRFSFSLFVFAATLLASWSYYGKQEQNRLDQKFLDAERLLKEAELAGLRQQMQPHFLFNSLNSINSLIGQNPQEARKMVIQLSDFLRGTLSKDLDQFISLGEELEHLSLYLSIEKVRFGHRLNVHVPQLTEEEKAHSVPAMILQPVLENAIKYGLYGTLDAIDINIKFVHLSDFIMLEISNPFDDDSSVSTGTGFGLKSIQRRLALIYNRYDLLETTCSAHIFITRIKIPTTYAHLSDH